MSAAVKPEIFKAYDIRGVYGEDIDAEIAYALGRAYAQVIAELENKPAAQLRLGLGRDMRLSAPELAERYSEGMQAEGATVIDAGQVGTEMLYFLVGSRELDGGLMCTASHNPKKYTGAKLVRRGAVDLDRRRPGRDRDALLPRRIARARRRPHVHGLAQPQEVHGREAGQARCCRAIGRRRDRRD